MAESILTKIYRIDYFHWYIHTIYMYSMAANMVSFAPSLPDGISDP